MITFLINDFFVFANPSNLGQNFGHPLWSSLLFFHSFSCSPASVDGLTSLMMKLGSSDPYDSLFHLRQLDIIELVLVRALDIDYAGD